jgi:phosphosulfolactate phosphohydrolase-like enzyme
VEFRFLARRLFLLDERNLPAAFAQSCNGRQLLAHPDLCEDVAFCAQRDHVALVAGLTEDGSVFTW